MTKIAAGTHMLVFFHLMKHGSSFEHFENGAFVTLQKTVSETEFQQDMNTIMAQLVVADPSVVNHRLRVVREGDHALPNYLQFSPIDYTIDPNGVLAPMEDRSNGPRWTFMPSSSDYLAPDAIIPANSLVRIVPDFGNGIDIRLVRTHVDMTQSEIYATRNAFEIVEKIDAFIDANVTAGKMSRVAYHTIDIAFPDYAYTDDNAPIQHAERMLFNIIHDHAKKGKLLTDNSPEIASLLTNMRTRGSVEYPARNFAMDDMFIVHAPSNEDTQHSPQMVINWKNRQGGGIMQSVTDPSGHDSIGIKRAFIRRAA